MPPPSVYILVRCSGTNVFSQKTSGTSSCSKGTCCGTRLCGTVNPLCTGVHSSCWFAWVVPGGSPHTSEAVLVNNTTSSLQRITGIFVFLTSYFLCLGRAMLSFLSDVPELFWLIFWCLFFQRWSYSTWPLPGSSILCSLLCGVLGWRDCAPNTFLSLYSTLLVLLVLFDGIIVNSLTMPGARGCVCVQDEIHLLCH